jgi:hypothetical protein
MRLCVPSFFEFMEIMKNLRPQCIFLFCIVIIASCKEDNLASQAGSKNFSLTNISLGGQSFKYSYSNVSTTPSLVLSFSDRIDHQSAQSNVVLSSPSSVIPVNLSFSNNDSTITVEPTAALKYFSVYYLQIFSSLTSISKKEFSADIQINLTTKIDTASKFTKIPDAALLDLVQQQTIKYFYDFGHPACGMARERNTSGDMVTTGGSGFGLMAMIAGINRGFIPRADGIARFTKIISFLETADRFHGAWPHWINGSTGKIIPFSTNDDGADLVETSYLAQGLITVRQYLTSSDTVGNNLINRINTLWQGIEFDWFRQNNQNVLYWHWSPDKGWIMNFPLYGYFEEQITYFMAAASPTHSIPLVVYANGYTQNGAIKTGNTYTYNGESYVLPLGTPSPLFWVQYSYLGLNPHFVDSNTNTDYWIQNVNASRINHAYCVANPKKFAGYADNCWGLTASDNPSGYGAQSPANDNGTISPTAAISSMPYTPTESMNAIKFFYYTLGDRMWGPYGFYDAFNITAGWTATSTLAIDQGPMVVMIENYRTQLLWNLFMSAPEVQAAKTKLGFN